MKKRIINTVLKYPGRVVIIFSLLTIIAGIGLYRIKIDTSLKSLLPDDIPSKKIMDRLVELFGEPDFVMVAVGNKGSSVYNISALTKIYNITEELAQDDNIEKVLSIANLKNIETDNSGFVITDIIGEPPQNNRDILRIKKIISKNKDYRDMFISKNNDYAIVIGMLKEKADEDEIYDFLKKIKEKYRNPEEIIIGGMPVIRSYIFNHIISDLLILIPIVAFILMIVLYLSLKDIAGLRITGMIIGGSVMFTLGLMSWLNIPLKIVTSSMPVILISIACADSIHLITRFHDYLKSGKSKEESIFFMLDSLMLPVILTSVTTIIGFLSLTTAVLPALRTYGIFISIGVLWALMLSLFFLPAMLKLSKVSVFQEKDKGRGIFDKLIYNLSDNLKKNKKIIFVIFTVLIIFSIYGIKYINIEMNPESFFPADSKVKKDSEFLNSNFGGSVDLNIMIEGDIKEPRTLKNMLKIESYLKKDTITGPVRSIADIIKKLNKVFQGSEKYNKIPENKAQVSQLLLLYSMSGDSSDFDRFVDYDYKTAVINARVKSSSTKVIRKLVYKLEKYIKKENFSDIKIYLTGSSVFFSELVFLLIKSCLLSIIVSLFFVFIISGFSFKSVRFGLYSIIPLSVAVVVDFGLMGWLGIDLSHVTAMLSAVVIGVGIDYAIHYISSYIDTAGKDEEQRIKAAIITTGKPILFNAFSVAIGFSVLLLSSFLPIKFLGGLIAISMISCAAGALTILPLLIKAENKD